MTLGTITCLYLTLPIFIQTISSYRHFQSSIPNGGKVVNPCHTQSTWAGVGHHTKEGGSDRNPFGQDFSEHNKVWTKSLCLLDSDGDGLSNGEELGDPDCTWTPGTETKNPAKSHPGVCEPMTSPECVRRNVWLDCTKANNLDQAVCTSINNSSTFSKDLKLMPTQVPSRETTYFCQLFDLNITSDLHMIATQPLIAASEVVHHILMFGCDRNSETEHELRSPYPCNMVPHEACRSLIGAWTVGSPGECAHPEMGFRVGPGGYNIVAIQIHWNNPQRISGITDSSGLRIHLTSSLRKFDAGMLVVGQQFLQIESSITGMSGDQMFSAACPERCTQVMFTTPIKVTSAVNHMHYLGKSQEIKIYKNNSIIKTITDQHNYNYDDPFIYTFPEPIQINPGEEIRTSCVYKRTLTSNPVCWGEATSDEMCFGFITYYPLLQNLSFPWCTSVRSFPSCDRHLPSLGKHPVGGCRWWEFRNENHPETKKNIERVFDKCYPDKLGNLQCTDECQEVARHVADHPCLQGAAGSYMIDRLKLAGPAGHRFLDAVITCSCRDFSYCDRKTKQGILGSRRAEFCTSLASCTYTNLLIFILLISLRYL